MKLSSSHARAWLQRRNIYTLDRPSPSTTRIAPSSPFLMTEPIVSTQQASYVGSSSPLSAAYILDPPPGLSSSSSSLSSTCYTLERVRYSASELESSALSFPSSSSSMYTAAGTKSTPIYNEPWLSIAAGGILSFAGLMWLGEMEAASKKEEMKMLNISNGTPVTDPTHGVGSGGVHAKNHKKDKNDGGYQHRGPRTKAEWFRPY